MSRFTRSKSKQGAALLAAVGLLSTQPIVSRAQDRDEYVEGGALPSGADLVGPRDVASARAQGRGIRIGRAAVRPAVIPPTYEVREGDTLWDITQHFYGDPFEWPRVWSYNPEITNPNWIYPLDQLRLLREGSQPVAAPTSNLTHATRRAAAPMEVYLRDEGFLDPEEMARAGELTGSTSDHMLLMPYELVYVQYRDDVEPPAVGTELSVYSQVLERDRTPEETGTLVRIFGTVRVESYDEEEHLVRARIIEALDPIERGYHIAAIPRRFVSVSPVRNAERVETTVVATLRPRSIVGEHQLIFLGAGAEEGVQPGNRFFILSHGDSWQETIDANSMDPGSSVPNPRPRGNYPDEIVAELLVVHVDAHTAAAFVTNSLHESAVGDRALMREGY